ncbi:hypothetical protein [Herbidospora sp. NBRC 101105]|uniref:hypothetical protein n=1 Tax=Herbidospora sp. NBRC 101105 TaxID=3032195 RepID=UPI0024A58ADF|nr:hypothetical protein [Herbidospora sp. NBRC 101105]GLX98024.1 hypothetical protein Hesp01_59740 [Herbidospora sp. NBRC 101105]
MPADLVAWPSDDDYVRALSGTAEFGAGELRGAWVAMDGAARPRSFRWPGGIGFEVSAESELVLLCFTSAAASDRCHRLAAEGGGALHWHHRGIAIDGRWIPVATHDRDAFDPRTDFWAEPAEDTRELRIPRIPTATTVEPAAPSPPPVVPRPALPVWLVPVVAVMVALAMAGLVLVSLA